MVLSPRNDRAGRETEIWQSETSGGRNFWSCKYCVEKACVILKDAMVQYDWNTGGTEGNKSLIYESVKLIYR